MPFDPEAEFMEPVPDHVPDDLTHRYQRSARRTVRLSRARGYPIVRSCARKVRRAGRTVRHTDVWLVGLTIFVWTIVGAGALAALVYAVMLLPGAVPLLVLPTIGLLVVSLGIAAMAARRKEREPQPTPF
jgi:hypothetical protein